eukprot:227714-Chlamydomonas_euryale.AAC.2
MVCTSATPVAWCARRQLGGWKTSKQQGQHGAWASSSNNTVHGSSSMVHGQAAPSGRTPYLKILAHHRSCHNLIEQQHCDSHTHEGANPTP